MKVMGISDVLFTDTINLYVASTGSDTTGDGSSGTPWLTLQKAFDYVSYLRLAYPCDININIADAHYSWTGPLLCVTPWGSRVRVQGTTVYEKSMTSVQSAAGDAITVNLNSVANIEVGDLAIFHTCANGTAPYHMAGCHIVTNVDAVNTRITITTKSLVGLPSGAVTATVEILKTVITISSGSGIYALPAMKVDKLGLIGNGGASMGLYTSNVARMTLAESSYVGITGFGVGISIAQGGQVNAVNGAGRVSVSGCTTGVHLQHQSGLVANAAQITGCATGILCQLRSVADLANAKLHGNMTGIYCLQGAYVNATGADTTGNGTAISPTANTEGNDHAYIET